MNLLFLGYNNLLTPGGILFPLVFAAAVTRNMYVFVIGYGIVVPIAVVGSVAYHLHRLSKREQPS